MALQSNKPTLSIVLIFCDFSKAPTTCMVDIGRNGVFVESIYAGFVWWGLACRVILRHVLARQ
jgi:hypothetical protein